jgi:hypothetical protein
MNTWFAYFNDVMGLVRWMETHHKKPATLPAGLFGMGGGTNALAMAPANPEPIAASLVASEEIEHQKRILGLTEALCRQLEAESAIKRAARLNEILGRDWLPDHQTCHSEWKALREAIEDDVKNRYAQYMPRDYAKLVIGIDAEWKVPLSKFPIRGELSAAVHCLALRQPTACVFHLMRGMEAVVKRLGRRFGLPAGQDVTWVVLTGNMTDKIASWPKATEAQKRKRQAWSAAVSNLHHVGRATRNPTMHPAKNYTPQEAKEVYDATRAFMTEVAELLGAAS